jgi:ribosomal-protein-alanine N-acetyltransferase
MNFFPLLIFLLTGQKGAHHFMALPFKVELVRREHAPALLDYCIRNREHLQPFEPVRPGEYYTLEHQEKVIEQSLLAYKKDTGYAFGIFIENVHLIGRVNLSNVVRGVFQNATLGYSIDFEYTGRGWMSDAVRWVTQFGFSSLLLHRIQAAVMPHNTPSIRVLEKCGFRQEGLAQRYLKINDQWQDHLLFAITLEESPFPW